MTGDSGGPLHEQAAAYALGALDQAEVGAFEEALARSPELQREVAELREVGALLAAGTEAVANAGLKERLLRRVRSGSVQPIAPPTRRSRAAVWLASGLAASLLVSLGLGLQVARLRGMLTMRDSTLAVREAKLAAREQTLDAILEPGISLVPLTTTGTTPPGIQMFWNRDRHVAILHAFRLPPAAAGRAYQLWLIKDGVPVPSRVFNSDPDGHALVEGITIAEDQGIQAFAVTEEPETGSPQPTTPILLFGRVAG